MGKRILAWVAGISAMLGLILALRDVFSPILDRFQDSADTKQKIAVAQMQVANGNYAGAVDTYQQIVAQHPHSKAALDGEVDAAMARVRNYRQSGQSDADLAAKVEADLAKLIPVLETAAASAQGSRFADINAHLGWANGIRSGSPDESEPYLRKALAADAGNVYANAMLGLILTRDSKLPDALRHFETAVHTGKERPWVRDVQFDGLIFDDDDGAPGELYRLANEMRKNGEPLSLKRKHDVLGEFDLADYKRLSEMLSAVPPEEAWATFQWIDDGSASDSTSAEFSERRRVFIQASIDEQAGKKQEALARFQQLATIPGFTGQTYGRKTKEAIERLEGRHPQKQQAR